MTKRSSGAISSPALHQHRQNFIAARFTASERLCGSRTSLAALLLNWKEREELDVFGSRFNGAGSGDLFQIRTRSHHLCLSFPLFVLIFAALSNFLWVMEAGCHGSGLNVNYSDLCARDCVYMCLQRPDKDRVPSLADSCGSVELMAFNDAHISSCDPKALTI